MIKEQSNKREAASRRKFLTGAAAATAGAATLGFPTIVRAQGPISMRWQSTWPSKDIFHEYALDYAKKVNDMTGGDLRIEVLPAGAVVPAFHIVKLPCGVCERGGRIAPLVRWDLGSRAKANFLGGGIK